MKSNEEAKFWTPSPTTVQLQFRDTDQGTLTFKEGGSISTADLLVLTGPESAVSRKAFFHFQNNLILTSKDKEVSRTDASPSELR